MTRIPNPEAVAWAIATEGTISINQTKSCCYPNVNMYNTDRELIEKFWQLAGFYGYISKPSGYSSKLGNRLGWKVRHRWIINKREEVKEFLIEILPYLPTKVMQAKIVIDFCETGDTKWLRIIKILNTRGVRKD